MATTHPCYEHAGPDPTPPPEPLSRTFRYARGGYSRLSVSPSVQPGGLELVSSGFDAGVLVHLVLGGAGSGGGGEGWAGDLG